MSMESWKKEFYPIPASKARSDTQALKMVHLKWIGARLENLVKHGCIKLSDDYISDGKHEFRFNTYTCALCVLYYLKTGKCGKCPIFLFRGKPCDSPDRDSPYSDFYIRGNPEPMIALIELAMKSV